MFLVVPPLLVRAGLELPEHWKLYLPVVLASFVLMIPADPVRRPPEQREAGAHRRRRAVARGTGRRSQCSRSGSWRSRVLMLGVFRRVQCAGGAAALAGLAAGPGAAAAAWPSASTTPRRRLGCFLAGCWAAGWRRNYGTTGVFAVCAVLVAVWLVVALGMRAPVSKVNDAVNELSSLTFSIAAGVNLDGLHEALTRVHGVREAEVVPAERIARLKVVPGQWDEHRVRKLITGEV